MCTGIGWIYRCRGCSTVIVKDTHVSGHTCHEAKRARKRGCCRTGVEYAFFDKTSDELCLLCEIKDQVERLDASTCSEGECEGENRVGYCVAGEKGGYEEIQEYTPEQLKEWDEWKEEISSDEEGDEEGEYDWFNGIAYSGTTAVSETNGKKDDDEDDEDEDGGAQLQKGETKAEKKKGLPPWALAGSSLWRKRMWSIWNRPSGYSQASWRW